MGIFSKIFQYESFQPFDLRAKARFITIAARGGSISV